MRHGVKKIKIKSGKDANKMLMRKLAVNFVAHGKMVTTEKKAKVLKSYLETLLEKSKERTEANKNYLLRHFNSVKVVNTLFDTVGPTIKNTAGGYVKSKKIQQRNSDGALMVQLEWSQPVVVAEEVKEVPAAKAEAPAAEKPAKRVPSAKASGQARKTTTK